MAQRDGDVCPKILVVADEQEILNLMVECLSRPGYQVFPARDGQEALRILNAEQVELIVADLSMPGMNGLELIKAVKGVSPQTEILILTEHSSAASAIDAPRGGAFDHLTKPFDFAELEWGVKRALERFRLAEENRTLVRRLKEQRVQTEELAASQRRTLAMFNSIADSLMIVNRDFTIVEANEGAAALSGVPAQQLIGRKCYRELFAREEICSDCPVLATFATGGPALVSMHREERSGSRGPVVVEVCSYPLLSGAGVIPEAVEHSRDVTEQNRAEEDRLALRAERDKDDAMRVIGRLTADVAHNFNHQLSVIKGCVTFLLEAMGADDRGREDAERIRATVDQGARLVRELLSLGVERKIQPRPLSLADLVNQIAAMFRPLLGEQVLFDVRAAPGLWRVRVDPGLVEQVIMNLVVNAREALVTPGERVSAGTLTVEMANVELDAGALQPTVERAAPGQYVMLSVSDTGSGMTPEVKRRIFEPFFTTKETGTGLGLSMVFGIVKQYRGYVFGESEPGRGSTFRVYLPRAEGEEKAPAEALAFTTPPGLGG